MPAQEGTERGRTDFFLAFEDELHVVAEQAVAHEILEGFHLHEALSLVVVGTAGEDVPVAHFGLGGVGMPEVERCHGHHVVVAVDEHGGSGRVYDTFGVDERIALGGHHFGAVHAGLEEEFAPAFGAAEAVGVVGGFGTDAGDAQQAEEFVQEARFVLLEVVLHGHSECMGL